MRKFSDKLGSINKMIDAILDQSAKDEFLFEDEDIELTYTDVDGEHYAVTALRKIHDEWMIEYDLTYNARLKDIPLELKCAIMDEIMFEAPFRKYL